ncbi:MAG: MAPEG family protein [Hyphomonadaceae bacterium]|nr:MAPEG family protein [Hyphomonadaceae bacterium]
MHITIILCSASLVILTLLLAFWTSVQRGASKTIAYGTTLDPSSGMAKAQRAHGNAAEYAALLIGLFLIVGFAYEGRDLGGLVMWTIVAVTVSRLVHAIGFLICETLEKPHILKALGALVTYAGGLLLAVMAIIKVH